MIDVEKEKEKIVKEILDEVAKGIDISFPCCYQQLSEWKSVKGLNLDLKPDVVEKAVRIAVEKCLRS